MNSKERVKAAIARQQPDRVPLGLYAVDCDTAGRILGRETFIRNKPGIQLALWEGRRDEVAESLKRDVVELFQKLDIVDLISFKEAQPLPPRGDEPEMPKQIAEHTYEDASGRVWKLSWESNDVCVVHDPRPQPEAYTADMFPMPDPETQALPDVSQYEVFDHMVAHLGKDRYILSCTSGLGCMPLLGGMERGLMEYALAPEAVEACARANVARQNLNDRVAIRPGTDGAFIECDMAGSNGPMISPRQWEQICFPRLKERVDGCRQFADQVVLHCCGRTIEIMELIIEAGVDCYQSLQTLAGMVPGVLCERFGDRMAFWGGGPVEFLVGGTVADIRRATRESMEATKDYPGFIFGPSHSIAYGTKYDNFMAMLDEFAKLRDR